VEVNTRVEGEIIIQGREGYIDQGYSTGNTYICDVMF
jgi:hypothetical protein